VGQQAATSITSTPAAQTRAVTNGVDRSTGDVDTSGMKEETQRLLRLADEALGKRHDSSAPPTLDTSPRSNKMASRSSTPVPDLGRGEDVEFGGLSSSFRPLVIDVVKGWGNAVHAFVGGNRTSRTDVDGGGNGDHDLNMKAVRRENASAKVATTVKSSIKAVTSKVRSRVLKVKSRAVAVTNASANSSSHLAT
jgi:hypothetical protein